MESQVPIFLGMSQRAARRGYGWDLLGVSNVVLLPFFPQNIAGLQCVLGIPRRALREGGLSYRVVFTDEQKPQNTAWSDQAFSQVAPPSSSDTISIKYGFAVPALPPTGGTVTHGIEFFASGQDLESVEILPTSAPPLVVSKPGRILVDIIVEGQRYARGEFICEFVAPSPLSDDERRAIASKPGAPRDVRVTVGCKKCGETTVYFSSLDPSAPRSPKLPHDAISIHDAPASWACQCGEASFDLSYLRLGIHELFRQASSVPRQGGLIHFAPLYEAGRIQSIIGEYEQLIEKADEEEPVQKFLEENPLFWAFLSPQRILLKPPVLTKKKADFGILSSQKILYLVELEKPSTKLTNQDGGIAADIQRGANQIRDWQLVVDDHKLALLSELGFKEGEVLEIRYILIGGLTRRANATGLTKLRRTPFAPNTDFYCFDELGSFLHSLAGELHKL